MNLIADGSQKDFCMHTSCKRNQNPRNTEISNTYENSDYLLQCCLPGPHAGTDGDNNKPAPDIYITITHYIYNTLL